MTGRIRGHLPSLVAVAAVIALGCERAAGALAAPHAVPRATAPRCAPRLPAVACPAPSPPRTTQQQRAAVAVTMSSAAASSSTHDDEPQRDDDDSGAASLAAPIVSKETLERVKMELWRTSETDAAQLVAEQRDVIRRLLGELSAAGVAPSSTASSPGGGGDAERRMNELVAADLPVLLGRSFPLAAREVLGTVTTEAERGALLALSRFVMGVQVEIGDALSDLQWRQQRKLRELCDASLDGGTIACMELAEAMKDQGELDTDFCNYLNFAIEQEEGRLAKEGQTPFAAPPIAYGGAAASPSAVGAARGSAALAAAMEEEMEEQERYLTGAEGGGGGGRALSASSAKGGAAATGGGGGGWQRVLEGDAAGGEEDDDEDDDDEEYGEADDDEEGGGGGVGVWRTAVDFADPELRHAPSSSPASSDGAVAAGGGGGPAAGLSSGVAGAGGAGVAADAAQQQQWLLILRLVRQGVYSLLARDYTDDVKHLRVIIGLASAEARTQLTRQTLLAMSADEQIKFGTTVDRIAANLATPRDARDKEIHAKVVDVQSVVASYMRDFGGSGRGSGSGGDDFAQL